MLYYSILLLIYFMKKLCIYHGNCDDGFGAAYAVWKKFGEDNVEFYPATHDDAPPNVTGRKVIIVDFSYKRPVLEEMLTLCTSMVLIDHHKTAEADLTGLVDPKLTLVFDMTHSGAMLTWNYFFDVPAPELLAYVEDRDMWWKKLPMSEEVTIALRTYPQNFEFWDDVADENKEIRVNSIPQLQSEGMVLLRYYRSIIDNMKQKPDIRGIMGYKVPVMNAPFFVASDLANDLAIGHPFAVTYYIYGGKYRYSLRSAPDGIDVSEIAKKFGGGGHFHAAGFGSKESVHGR